MINNSLTTFSPTTTHDYTTFDQCLNSSTYKTIMVALFLLVIALSIVLNLLLWFGFIFKRRLRSIAVCYLISLSLSDFVTATTLAWMEVVYVMEFPRWRFGAIGSYLINAFWCFSLVTPFTHIVFITLDRYRAVTSSTLYIQDKSWRSELFKLGAIWIYSAAITLLFAFHFSPPTSDSAYEWNVLPTWYYPFLALHLVLPMLLCTVLYGRMVGHVRRHRINLQTYVGSHTQREFKMARSVAMIIGFLYAVWIPVIAMESLYATHAQQCFVSQLGTVSVWLTCTSGVINPVIFLKRNAAFRKAIFFCCYRTSRQLAPKMLTIVETSKEISSNSNAITSEQCQ